MGRDAGVRTASLSADRTFAWSETVPAAKCLYVAVGGEGAGSGIELFAFDDAGAVIDRAEGAHAASVRACAPPAGAAPMHFEARASAGQLEAVVGERTQD
jgi:hypothetical protein